MIVPFRYILGMCKALRNYLENNNIGKNELAERISVSRVAIDRYLTGARIPSKEVMAKIYAITHGDVTPNDFFGLPPRAKGGDTGATGDDVASFSPELTGRGHFSVASGADHHDAFLAGQIEMFAGVSS